MIGEARQGSCRTLAHSMDTSKSVKNKKKSMAEWSAVLAMYSLVEVEARSKQAPDTTVVFKIRSRHTGKIYVLPIDKLIVNAYDF